MKRAEAFLAAVIAGSLLSTPVRAADGDLDPTFGTGGKVVTSFEVPSATATSVALQPDGRIIVAGWLFDETANVDFVVARYRADGSLDPTFGSAGKVRTDFFGQFDIANSLALQSDGRIVVGGAATIGTMMVFALARYNSDGSLDSSFDSDGKVTGTFFGGINDLLLQPDSKIVVAGSGFHGGVYGDFTVSRYDLNGSLDPTFGTAGVVQTDFSGLGDGAYSLLLLPDGKLIALGYTETNVTGNDIALARYDANGLLDTTFGSGGKVTTDLGDNAFDAALQPDGKILVAGGGIVRYSPDGEVDLSFGDDGRARIDFPGFDDGAYAVAVQSDGKIVAAGYAFGPALYDFALSRFNSDGSADVSFGPGGGGVVTDFFGRSDTAYEVLIQPDGRIVAAGSATDATTGYLALARYLATPVTPAPTSCPHSAGFWKSHPNDWPVSSLRLGMQSYSAEELLALLGAPVRGDASILLAGELIAAKLNIAIGADSAAMLADVAAADELLAGYPGKLPYDVSPASSQGRAMVRLAALLASQNNRRSDPSCVSSAGRSTRTRAFHL